MLLGKNLSKLRFSVNSIRNMVIGTSILPILAACGEKVPEASDEQLLELLGSRSSFFGSEAPLGIPSTVVECTQLLSGLADEIVKDMPAEMLGAFKTECRRGLDDVLKDEAKNPMGFALAHFENQELAERIETLKKSTDEANRQAAAERREREEQEARAAKDAELEKLRGDYAAFVESISERVTAAEPACTEWQDLKAEINEAIQWNNWRHRNPPAICSEEQVTAIGTRAQQHLEALNAAEVTGSGTFFSFPTPYFGDASEEWFERQLSTTTEQIGQMRQDLAASGQ
ncbi:hypothetical protein MIC97_20845 [Aquamicrobium sp. NLF2-7]|uniref:hypothetical protein n=1 Tax=Aquamicrobium sp. NLF2-7 TaxID=2918753 RepID=UPI001EFB494E|nr:hypothetical protein [Aquamicrobium sp. NLF2-7]MCG8273935.1 hypothetical protein [Aquamicrobium sp. NLF2-7]